ncbi:MAG: TIGR03668 family PPOX class F420-dependent oxidoreductase [Actinomycetota bacterium]|nr:TIGR03668 family PPOX class F420-dependent oxidoreductase [Actinomycetota bacterium]
MAGGSTERIADLPTSARRIIDEARRAFLTTVGREGRPHTVPVCFALRAGDVVIAIDHKPKGGRRLERLRNIEANPAAALTVDRWDEDWTRLGWVMVQGEATIEAPGHPPEELLARYSQYSQRPPQGELIVVRPRRALWWSAA